MRRYYWTGLLALLAMLLVAGVTAPAHADDCTALGGTGGDTGPAPCVISANPNVKSGAFTIGTLAVPRDLNFVGTGTVTTNGLALDITVHGNLNMDPGTSINANNSNSPCRTGGKIELLVDGNVTTELGSSITSNACHGGEILIHITQDPAKPGEPLVPGIDHLITIDGIVESVGSASGTGSNQGPGGGPITIKSPCDVTITGRVSSIGRNPGADLVTVNAGCVLLINGIVESRGFGHAQPSNPPNRCGVNNPFIVGPAFLHPETTACVLLVAGDELIINAIAPNNGEVRADLRAPGKIPWIDIFVRGCTPTSVGPCPPPGTTGIKIINDYSGPFAVHADNTGATNLDGGLVTVRSRDSFVFATGFAISASTTGAGGQGGTIDVQAKLDVNLRAFSVNNPLATGGQFVATGSTAGGGAQGGGNIFIKSFGTSPLGSILGEIASLLNVSGGNPANGTVTLIACGTNSPSGAVNNAAMLAGTAAPAGIDFPPGDVRPLPLTATRPAKTFGVCGGNPAMPVFNPAPPFGLPALAFLESCPCKIVEVCPCVKATATILDSTLVLNGGLDSSLVTPAEGLNSVTSVVYSPTCDPGAATSTIACPSAGCVVNAGGTSATVTPAPPAGSKAILIIPGCNASLCLTVPTFPTN